MPAEILLLLAEGADLRADLLAGLTRGVREALLQLGGSGTTEAALTAAVLATDGPAAAPLLYFSLARLQRQGLVAYRAATERGALVTASSSNAFELRPPAVSASTRCVLSRFALLRREGSRFVIESGRSRARVTIDDPRVVGFLTELARPCALAELHGGVLTEEEVQVTASLLLGCGMLVEAEAGPSAEDDAGSALAPWEFHDLLFHSRSRRGRHHGPWGGTFRFRGLSAPLPATKPAMSDCTMPLERPDLERLLTADLPFTAVMEKRHSSRTFGDPPLQLRELGEFLYRSARLRTSWENERGHQLSSRVYPGGGSVYELEVYLSVGACDGLPPGTYHYDPREHCLHALSTEASLTAALLQSVTQFPPAVPQILVTLAARFGRVFWKYESMGYALILKDAGVLLQTMHLVAEAMGLGACVIGGGDSDLFAAAAGLNYYEETSVGELIIGSRASGQ